MDFAAALSHLNWLAVLVAAVLGFVIGGLWYSPVLFGRAWQAAVGLGDEELKGGQGRIFGASFALAFVGALVLGLFLGPEADAGYGATAGALVGLGWVATAMGITYLFERRSFKLYWIDAGYHAVTFTAMGALLGAWH